MKTNFIFQKLLTESQKDSLTKEFNGLNLTKYVGEVVSIHFHRPFTHFSSFFFYHVFSDWHCLEVTFSDTL